MVKRYMSITKGEASASARRENIKLKPNMLLPSSAARVAGRTDFF